MRIGCDLDGVLADLHRAFFAAALELFPTLDAGAIAAPDIGASPPDDQPDPDQVATASEQEVALSREQSRQVWRHLCGVPDFWDTLHEIEAGSVARLAALAETQRWELIFLTSRPDAAGRTVQRQSQRWLDRLGFPMPSVFVVHGSRGRIADAMALDVVIDDRAENCLDVALESKARAILVWRGEKGSVPASAKRLGIGVVPTVAACLDLLVQADQASGETLDLGQRLRRLLGLQPRAVRKG